MGDTKEDKGGVTIYGHPATEEMINSIRDRDGAEYATAIADDELLYRALFERRALTLSTYQVQAARTMKKQAQRDALLEAALGLMDEAGEVAGPVKKWAFHGHDLDKGKLAEELGDVLWYLAAMATALGLSLEGIATENIAKLKLRYPDGFSEERSRARGT